ncbi:hypothetical protein AS032_31760 [Rhodococcus qingshengii]|nr:hypothetical protein ABM90_03340 [Rhodococcus erythropolis]KSU67478.1 hypothetical protein AS032_31760 [Rhodococcus qingshengii]
MVLGCVLNGWWGSDRGGRCRWVLMLAGSLMIRPSWVDSKAPVEHSTGSWWFAGAGVDAA